MEVEAMSIDNLDNQGRGDGEEKIEKITSRSNENGGSSYPEKKSKVSPPKKFRDNFAYDSHSKDVFQLNASVQSTHALDVQFSLLHQMIGGLDHIVENLNLLRRDLNQRINECTSSTTKEAAHDLKVCYSHIEESARSLGLKMLEIDKKESLDLLLDLISLIDAHNKK